MAKLGTVKEYAISELWEANEDVLKPDSLRRN